MGKFLDYLGVPDGQQRETTDRARDAFQRDNARGLGYDPDNDDDMERYFQDQEQEWADRGVPDPGGGTSRVQNMDDNGQMISNGRGGSILD